MGPLLAQSLPTGHSSIMLRVRISTNEFWRTKPFRLWCLGKATSMSAHSTSACYSAWRIPSAPFIRPPPPFVYESYSLLMKDTPPLILPLFPNVLSVLGHSHLSIWLSTCCCFLPESTHVHMCTRPPLISSVALATAFFLNPWRVVFTCSLQFFPHSHLNPVWLVFWPCHSAVTPPVRLAVTMFPDPLLNLNPYLRSTSAVFILVASEAFLSLVLFLLVSPPRFLWLAHLHLFTLRHSWG